jgi:hypothetical protein
LGVCRARLFFQSQLLKAVALERKAKKAARKAAARQANQTLHSAQAAAAPLPLPCEPERVPVLPAPQIELPDDSQPEPAPSHPTASQAQIDANRANAQLSSGPKTEAGKAISSQNRRYHGLGAFQVMPWEDEDAFLTLRDDLRSHYHPADLVEQAYADRLAQHMWLRQRCLDLQPYCFDLEDDDTPVIEDSKQFALLARYQKDNERAMDKCVSVLEKFKAAHQKERDGFESGVRKEAAETRKRQAHSAHLRLSNARAKSIELDSEIRQTVEAPIPGHMRIPFNKLAACFRGAIREVSEEIQEEQAAA